MGSQFWDLDFTQGASHEPGPGIFLAHDFQDMDGEPSDFTVSEGHGHPLVSTDVKENTSWVCREAVPALCQYQSAMRPELMSITYLPNPNTKFILYTCGIPAKNQPWI